MWSRCFDVVHVLLVVLFFEMKSSTKSSPICPVRPPAAESGPRGDCQCSVLNEIQCRGLSAVPEIDVNASYVGRQTYRSLYLASQHIRQLPAAAFAALNVRRIVLDFNPIGDRIDARTFRGTVDVVDLARLGLVSRRRRTSRVVSRSNPLDGTPNRIRYFNASSGKNGELGSRQPDLATADEKRTITGSRRQHRQTTSVNSRDFNTSSIYFETGRGQAQVPIADQSRRRRHKPRAAVRKVGDSVKWERFPHVDNDYDEQFEEKFDFGLKYALVELSMGACSISNLPAGLLNDLRLLERLHLWGNLLETLPSGLFRHNGKLVELLLWGNHIDELDAAAFDGLRGLRRLDLDRNRLTVLPAAAVARLASLRALRLADNRIHAVASDSFAALPGLRALHLDGNGIAYIYPRAFHGLGNLSVLELDRNAVHFLPDDVFIDLGRLTELRLADNQVEHVWARTFRGLRSLHRLRLTSNRLGNLPNGAFGDSPSLRHVQLDGNRLQMIGRCALAPAAVSTSGLLRRARLTLTLDANPLHCDCRMTWLLDVVGSTDLRVSGTCWTDAVTPTPGGIMAALQETKESCRQFAAVKDSVYCLSNTNNTARQF